MLCLVVLVIQLGLILYFYLWSIQKSNSFIYIHLSCEQGGLRATGVPNSIRLLIENKCLLRKILGMRQGILSELAEIYDIIVRMVKISST